MWLLLYGDDVMNKVKVNRLRNFVAKHMLEFNKASVEVDRKREAKNGKVKHKKEAQVASFDIGIF